MNQLNKIPSVIQIWVAEFLAVMFLFPIVSKLYERLHPSVGYKSLPLDKIDYVFFVVGLLLYLWLLKEIFLPRVKRDSWFSFKTASSSGGEYYFASTHPSYIFVDVLAVAFWWLIRWGWSQAWQERTYQGTILLLLAALIPVVRLLAWYVLRFRPNAENDEEVAKAIQSAWKPVALIYALSLAIGVVTAAVIIPTEMYREREQARKEASLAVVDAASWKGSETFESLRDMDSSVDGQIATRVIRLRATQKSAEAMTCTNDAGQGEYVTVLASLGSSRYDDVLIFTNSGVDELVGRAKGNVGKPIEAMGRLTQMPDKVPAWKKYCGLEKISPRPFWVFVEEHP